MSAWDLSPRVIMGALRHPYNYTRRQIPCTDVTMLQLLLIDLHHYNNPHDLMISVTYTTCSYHGDQPFGEYLSHVSFA